MAIIRIDRSKLLRFFLTNEMIERDLNRRANNVLTKLQETAPRDTGDLAASFRVQMRIDRGKKLVQIMSSDPQIKSILHGTGGPYNAVPPWGPGSALGGWGSRHGFTTRKSMYALARSVASHGTKPAGVSSEGVPNWVQEAVREAR